MAKVKYIVFLALCLASCKTASQFPMDDAYYRPAPETVLPVTRNPSPVTPNPSPVTPNPSPVTPNPSIEYLNVQDTTVTIRIKK